MRYLNAIQAAKIIGVSDRTVRDWVKAGKLSAHHATATQLAIPENEVEAIARERRQYQVDIPDAADLALKLAELEQKYQEVLARLTILENTLAEKPIEAPAREVAITRAPVERQPRRTHADVQALPDGAILCRDFAQQHGLNPYTFRDHYTKGLVNKVTGVREKAIVSSRPKPGRAGETEYYLTAEQIPGVLDFWRQHEVSFNDPGESLPPEEQSNLVQHSLIVAAGAESPSGTVSAPEKLSDQASAGAQTTLYDFADRHKVNRNETVRRYKMGMLQGERQGRHDQDIVLSEQGMRDFYVQFHDEPEFYTCDQCPHTFP